MTMTFQFDLDKAVQVMAYMLGRIGPTDKVKLMKLVYLADREHFIAHGYPITGDDQYAMKAGPVPSLTLDAIDGDFEGARDRVFAFLHLDDYVVSLKKMPELTALSVLEVQTLDRVIQEHGGKEKWALVQETHGLPEYAQLYVPGTATRIPYEKLAQVCGKETRFRKNRPVISREAAARMICPFPSEAKL